MEDSHDKTGWNYWTNNSLQYTSAYTVLVCNYSFLSKIVHHLVYRMNIFVRLNIMKSRISVDLIKARKLITILKILVLGKDDKYLRIIFYSARVKSFSG